MHCSCSQPFSENASSDVLQYRLQDFSGVWGQCSSAIGKELGNQQELSRSGNGEFGTACAVPRILPHFPACPVCPCRHTAPLGIATENIEDLKQLSLVCFSASSAVRRQNPTGQNAWGCHLWVTTNLKAPCTEGGHCLSWLTAAWICILSMPPKLFFSWCPHSLEIPKISAFSVLLLLKGVVVWYWPNQVPTRVTHSTTVGRGEGKKN